jgi:DNA-binding MarR family transcriptional regulator
MVDQKRRSELRQGIETFYFAYREFTSQPDQILANLGLNRAHHRILYFVGRNPGIGVGSLLEILKISKQALHAPLRQLIDLNLVASSRDNDDRRAKCLELTRQGATLEMRLTEVQMQLLEKAFNSSQLQAEKFWMMVMQEIVDSGEDK